MNVLTVTLDQFNVFILNKSIIFCIINIIIILYLLNPQLWILVYSDQELSNS